MQGTSDTFGYNNILPIVVEITSANMAKHTHLSKISKVAFGITTNM